MMSNFDSFDDMVLEFDERTSCDESDIQFDSNPKKIELNFGSDIRPVIGGSSDYNTLNNKPQINGVTLEGNKTSKQIGISRITNEEIEQLFK